MQYNRIYEQLITRGQERESLEGYVEKHHIIPRALGGSDDPSNIVKLTAREHFVAHLLLAKMYGGKMWHAANIMSNCRRYTSKDYAYVRKRHALEISKRHKGKIVSQEMRDKISQDTVRHAKISKALKGRSKTPEHCFNLSKANKGKKLSDETKAKISIANTGANNSMYGKTHTNPSRQKISESNLQRVTCPHCNKEGGIAAMHRWHFDNCPVIKPRVISESLSNRKSEIASKLVQCPHCKTTTNRMAAGRWHFDKCKEKDRPSS